MIGRILPFGPEAVLVELERASEVLALVQALRSAELPGVIDIVPAARTVLVRAERGRLPVAAIEELVVSSEVFSVERSGHVVEVPVVYDGFDLGFVAEAVGISIPEVVDRHTSVEYTVAFCGFAPGFAYLTGLDPSLHLPRRREPRPRVPSGSVAIASEYASVYPGSSPGGWHLLGRTDLLLWDPDRTPPALLVPGTRVRFVAVGS